MMKLLSALTILFFLSTAFRNDPKSGIEVTYGVCNAENPSVLLQLHEDLSFEYIDLSSGDKPIKVFGHYKWVKNSIQLETTDTTISFHHKWKLSEEGKVAKSRKGLSYYRLVKVDGCDC